MLILYIFIIIIIIFLYRKTRQKNIENHFCSMHFFCLYPNHRVNLVLCPLFIFFLFFLTLATFCQFDMVFYSFRMLISLSL